MLLRLHPCSRVLILFAATGCVWAYGCDRARHRPWRETNPRFTLRRLASRAETLVIRDRKLPQPDLQALVQLLDDLEQFSEEDKRTLPGLLRGEDAWGNEILMFVHDDG